MTYLYRYYDADGTLLYIGIASDMARRSRQHASTSGWWPEAVKVVVEDVLTRKQAEILEACAIRAERPRHNVQHAVTDPQVVTLLGQPDRATAVSVIESLGRGAVCDVLEIGASALSNATKRGSLPPSWFVPLRDLGASHGVAVPEHIFGWARPTEPDATPGGAS